jgi:hypothetical protein
MLKKNNLANFQRIIELFTQKMSLCSQNYGFGIRDPRSGIRESGSEIRDPEKSYSGSQIQGSKRHRFPDPQHCWVPYTKPYVPTFQRKRKEHGRGNAGTIILCAAWRSIRKA